MTHLYIEAYRELKSQDKVAERFKTSRHAVLKIIDPLEYKRQQDKKNARSRQKTLERQQWVKANRQRIYNHFEVLIARGK